MAAVRLSSMSETRFHKSLPASAKNSTKATPTQKAGSEKMPPCSPAASAAQAVPIIGCLP